MGKRLFVQSRLLMLWLLVSTILTIAAWEHITTLSGWDPDDQLRLVQVRDFINGQGWFDTNQYRLNPPDGAPMHWSRLIELPIAALILIFKPVFGGPIAEMIAGTVVPLTGLGMLMFITSRITAHLGGRQAGIMAAIMVILAPTILQQFLPMRIDHHGWQAVLAALAYWTLFWTDKARAGVVMGLALAIWMHISLEGLPLSAGFFLLLGWRWMYDKSQSTHLMAAISSFAVASFTLFFATQKTGLAANAFCDTISPPHIYAIFAAFLIMVISIRINPEKLYWRALAAAIAGITALAIILAIAPQCGRGAFSGLDPLVRQYWYIHILEGQPIWRHGWGGALPVLAPLLCGLGALVLLTRSHTQYRGSVQTAGFFLCYVAILSCLVFRIATVATIFAIPLIAILAGNLWQQYRSAKLPKEKIGIALLIFLLIIPGAITARIITAYDALTATTQNATELKMDAANIACASIPSITALNALEPAIIIAPFDIGPAILLTTPHKVLASSHHRNERAMHDHIEIFRSPPDKAYDFITAHGITHMVVCPTEHEMRSYQKSDPDGLWAMLAAGNTPEWLTPMPDMGQGMKIWKVTPKPAS